jgi:hypothetical protein
MSEAKFTKGEWVQCFANGIVIQTESTGYGICRVIGNLESDRANANLIACAPEMYAMLEDLYKALFVDLTTDNMPSCAEVSALLAKARGEK